MGIARNYTPGKDDEWRYWPNDPDRQGSERRHCIDSTGSYGLCMRPLPTASTTDTDGVEGGGMIERRDVIMVNQNRQLVHNHNCQIVNTTVTRPSFTKERGKREECSPVGIGGRRRAFQFRFRFPVIATALVHILHHFGEKVISRWLRIKSKSCIILDISTILHDSCAFPTVTRPVLKSTSAFTRLVISSCYSSNSCSDLFGSCLLFACPCESARRRGPPSRSFTTATIKAPNLVVR